MATREPEPPEELSIGTDLNLKKNKPFRMVDHWTTREHLIFLAVGILEPAFLIKRCAAARRTTPR